MQINKKNHIFKFKNIQESKAKIFPIILFNYFLSLKKKYILFTPLFNKN